MRSKEKRSGSNKNSMTNLPGTGNNNAGSTNNNNNNNSSNSTTGSCRLQHASANISADRKSSPIRKRRHGVVTVHTNSNTSQGCTGIGAVTSTQSSCPTANSTASISNSTGSAHSVSSAVGTSATASINQLEYSNDPYEFSDQKTDDAHQRFELNHTMRPRPENDVCLNCNLDSEETMTDPDILGPCEPGMNIVLKGIVWLETKGMLVVNVTWRNRSYMGTLLDTSEMSFPPINMKTYQPPFECRSTMRGRGKRKNVLANRTAKHINNSVQHHPNSHNKNHSNKRDGAFAKPSAPTGNSTPDGSDEENGCGGKTGGTRRHSPSASDDGCASVKSVSVTVVPLDANSFHNDDAANGVNCVASADAENIYQCQAKGCEHKFPSFTSLRYHIDRYHNTVAAGNTGHKIFRKSIGPKKSVIISSNTTVVSQPSGAAAAKISRRGSPSKKRDKENGPVSLTDVLPAVRESDEQKLSSHRGAAAAALDSPVPQREEFSGGMDLSSSAESTTPTISLGIAENKYEHTEPAPPAPQPQLLDPYTKTANSCASSINSNISSCTSGINGLRIGHSPSHPARTVNSHLVNIPTLMDTNQTVQPSAQQQQQVSTSIGMKPFIRFPFANIPSQSSPGGGSGVGSVGIVSAASSTVVTAALPTIPGTNLFSKTSATTTDLLVSTQLQQQQTAIQSSALKPIQPRSVTANAAACNPTIFNPRPADCGTTTTTFSSVGIESGKPVTFPPPPPPLGCHSPQIDMISRKRTISPLVTSSVSQDSVNCILVNKSKRPCSAVSPLPFSPVISLSQQQQQQSALNHSGNSTNFSGGPGNHLLEDMNVSGSRPLIEELIPIIHQTAVTTAAPTTTSRSQQNSTAASGASSSGGGSVKNKISPAKSDGSGSIPFLTDAAPSPAYSDISEVNDDCPAPILEIEEEHKSPTTGGMNPPALVPAVIDDCTPASAEGVSSSSAQFDNPVGSTNSRHQTRKQNGRGNNNKKQQQQFSDSLLPTNNSSSGSSGSSGVADSLNASSLTGKFNLTENVCGVGKVHTSPTSNVITYKPRISPSGIISVPANSLLAPSPGSNATSYCGSNIHHHSVVLDSGTVTQPSLSRVIVSVAGAPAVSSATSCSNSNSSTASLLGSNVSSVGITNSANSNVMAPTLLLPPHHVPHHNMHHQSPAALLGAKVFGTHVNTAANILQNFTPGCAGDSSNYITINNPNLGGNSESGVTDLLLQNAPASSYFRQKDQ